MTHTCIPISHIHLEDRQRIDHSDTDGLKESLQRHGTIQPILIEPLAQGHPFYGPHLYRLIAGGRRLTFLKELGHTELYHGSTYDPARPGYLLGRELTKEEMHELELEENIRRKAMTWQEHALAVANIHRLKIIRMGEQGKSWTQQMLGEMLNIAAGKVNYLLAIAAELRDPASPLWKMAGPWEAIQYFEDKRLEEAMKENAKRVQATAQAVPDFLMPDAEDFATMADEEKELARQRYLDNPHNDPAKFDEYWAEKKQYQERPPVIPITPRLYQGSCLHYLTNPPCRFDHIITDPPYAIDMDNLDQQNVGMSKIDMVAAEHEVDNNLELLTSFIPLAYDALKDRGFLIMWCDVMVWQHLYDIADATGFKVQRWPITWVKTHPCMNAAVSYNFTKTTEIAMVCRKGPATLCTPNIPSHIVAGHDEYKDKMKHPFVKPFSVWRHLIEAVSIEGQTILDPFAGHGSGVLSLARMNRNYFACELVEDHFNNLKENVRQYYLGLNPNTQFI